MRFFVRQDGEGAGAREALRIDSACMIKTWTASQPSIRSFDPLQPLPADDTQLYVDWQRELFDSDDIKLQLARGFARSIAGVPVTRLFTGHRGPGRPLS
jgi:hypothetical protein